jgi:hypothetical protein
MEILSLLGNVSDEPYPIYMQGMNKNKAKLCLYCHLAKHKNLLAGFSWC